jgi:hypothetical protein
MYQLGETVRIPEGSAQEASQYVGKLAIMRRIWTMPDHTNVAVPAHIGIVTGVTHGLPIILEAKAGKRYGRVVERPMQTMQTMIGTIAVEALCRYVQYGDETSVKSFAGA